MIKVLREYTENNLRILEYTKDGTTISSVVKTPIPVEVPPATPQPNLADKINYLYYKATGVIA